MLSQHKKRLATTFCVIDIFIILVSFCVAYCLRFGWKELSIPGIPIQFQIFFLTYLIAWIYLSSRFKLYTSKRITAFWYEAWDVCKTTAICLLIATLPAFFIREHPLSRIFLLYLWPLQTGALILFRFVLRKTLKYFRRRGYNFRQIIIVGRNERAAKIVKQIKENPEFGLYILGYIDAPGNGNNVGSQHDLKLMGSLKDLEKILTEKVIDEVIVTLPFKSFYSEIEKIVHLCEQVGVEVKISTDLFSLTLAKESISRLGDIQVIDLFTSPKMSCQLMVKRLIDIITSAILLVLFSPLFAIVSILIKTTSKGPIFFKQQRVSYNGRQFSFLKFRTMIENAEELKKGLMALNEMDGPVFKIKNDPRATKIGQFLRKTSIDELPQLINVLKGDMSLVGPRPPLPSEVLEYGLADRRRLSMRPGITCIWQVNGRNDISFEKWMELDREYIDNWSLGLDLKILAKTIPSVIRGSGAS